MADLERGPANHRFAGEQRDVVELRPPDAGVLGDPGDRLPVRPQAATLASVVTAASHFATAHGTPDRRFLLAAGNSGIEAATNIVVKQSNARMLMCVYAAVIALCAIAFRSWRAVIVAVLPLLLTSVMAEALMVGLGIGLKVATLPVVALSVGIGVDYALYLLSVQLAHQRAGASLPRRLPPGHVLRRQDGGAGRHHAGGRSHHLGLVTDQVPGRHGHPAHLHVRVEHAGRV